MPIVKLFFSIKPDLTAPQLGYLLKQQKRDDSFDPYLYLTRNLHLKLEEDEFSPDINSILRSVRAEELLTLCAQVEGQAITRNLEKEWYSASGILSLALTAKHFVKSYEDIVSKMTNLQELTLRLKVTENSDLNKVLIKINEGHNVALKKLTIVNTAKGAFLCTIDKACI